MVIHHGDDGDRVRVEIGIRVTGGGVLGVDESLKVAARYVIRFEGAVGPGFDDRCQMGGQIQFGEGFFVEI